MEFSKIHQIHTKLLLEDRFLHYPFIRFDRCDLYCIPIPMSSLILLLCSLLSFVGAFRLPSTGQRFNMKSLSMATHRLILVRHGESTWNQENKFTGWYDCPLSGKALT